jgi:Ca2+-binding RTX toxin-like protein
MEGGAGDDTYVVSSAGDAVIEESGGGSDTASSALISVDLSSASGSFANVENATLTGSLNLDLGGTAGTNVLGGNAGKNLLSGLDGDDALMGGGGNDDLRGGDGADVLDGGSGSDTMIGGNGDDRYVIDVLGDVVTELAGAGTGSDTAQSAVLSLSLASYANVENLALTGSASLNLTGNAGQNTLTGNSGNNTLIGGGSADRLVGGNGNDVLNGGAGSDTMAGGAGDDRYTIDLGLDRISELAGEGIDEVRSDVATVDLALFANVENASLTGSANLALGGSAGGNRLTGNAGANIINGRGGNDQLIGAGGADRFMFETTGDADEIGDFEDDIDVLDLTDFGFSTVGAALALMTETGPDVVFAFAAGTQVIIRNTTIANMSDDILV